MTDREKAIVMAYTGIVMLKGDKFKVFHGYVEELFGREVYTHEFLLLHDEIKERSKADFLKLCEETEQELKWIPLTKREMTEEEKENYINLGKPEMAEYGLIFNCQLPDSEEEVLITINGYVSTDVFINDDADGCYFELYDIDDVTAWMPLPEPLPKPYKGVVDKCR